MSDTREAPRSSEPACTVEVYRCARCERCFVAAVASPGETLLCPCGAPLVHEPLAERMYEILASAPLERRVGGAEREAPAPARELSAPPPEADLGYGASHGNRQGHGGPSGPGDAPAPVAPADPSTLAAKDDDAETP